MVCEWKFEEELDVRIVSCISLKIFNNYEKKKNHDYTVKKKKKKTSRQHLKKRLR